MRGFGIGFLIGAFLWLAACAYAEWINVHSLALDYIFYTPKGRAPLISDNGLGNREPAHRVGLDMELRSLDFVYWANRVEGKADRLQVGDGGQFRAVGWKFEAGFKVIPQVDVYYFHHSQHSLDTEYNQGFPVEDGFGFRLKVK